MLKYVKIKRLGDADNKGIFNSEVEITEKLDGANMRTLLTKDQRIFGSRNLEFFEQQSKQFQKAIDYINLKLDENQKELNKIINEYGNLVLFGEAMLRHTIGYSFDKFPPFIGFDIYNITTERFHDRETKVKIFTRLGLDTVKLISSGVMAVTTEFEVPKSAYYNGFSEGVVIKNYEDQIFAKIVREEFKEKAKEACGFNKKYSTNDTEKFVAIYCTNARIEKMIFKQIDEDKKLEMQLMAIVPMLVYNDIWDEEYKDIRKSQLVLNLKAIRNLINKRCLNVLLQMIENNR